MSVALSPYRPLSPGILLVLGCLYWLMRNHAAFSERNSSCDRLCFGSYLGHSECWTVTGYPAARPEGVWRVAFALTPSSSPLGMLHSLGELWEGGSSCSSTCLRPLQVWVSLPVVSPGQHEAPLRQPPVDSLTYFCFLRLFSPSGKCLDSHTTHFIKFFFFFFHLDPLLESRFALGSLSQTFRFWLQDDLSSH